MYLSIEMPHFFWVAYESKSLAWSLAQLLFSMQLPVISKQMYNKGGEPTQTLQNGVLNHSWASKDYSNTNKKRV